MRLSIPALPTVPAPRPPGEVRPPRWAGRRRHLPGRTLPAGAALLLAALLPVAGCTDRGERIVGSGPATGSASGQFASAAACGACHPRHFAEWKTSMHAFAGSDPVMHAIAEIAAREPGETVGETCFACHAPAQVRQERWLASLPPGSVPETEDLSQDGISCDVCHSVAIVPPVASIDFLEDVDPGGPKRAGLRDPIDNPFHESAMDNSFTTSASCAPCHQVNLDDGTGLENTFREWESSFLSGFGVECQNCHMPQYAGQAATDSPPREDLHHHYFTGVGYAYEDFRGIDLQAQKDRIRDLLRNAVTVELLDRPDAVAPGTSFTFFVRVANDNTGHSIPSGTSFSRQMWIEVTARDPGGSGTIYRSGYLTAGDDLVTPEEDPDLSFFGSTMTDAAGRPTFFTWRAVDIDESHLLPFGQSRTSTYAVDVPPGATGPLRVDVTLRFRPIPPALLRSLGLERLLPVEIFDVWSGSFDVAVVP